MTDLHMLTDEEYSAYYRAHQSQYRPTDRCLGAGCYCTGLTEDWAAKVRKEHGERVQFRNWVNGRKTCE